MDLGIEIKKEKGTTRLLMVRQKYTVNTIACLCKNLKSSTKILHLQ